MRSGRPSFTLATGEGEVAVTLGLHGEHHVGNALSVAAVALERRHDAPQVAEALGDARPLSRWRMEVNERADGVTVVNDAYNANPDSIRAALKALAAMGRARRTWAVLGEMLELGQDSVAEHDAIGRLAVAPRHQAPRRRRRGCPPDRQRRPPGGLLGAGVRVGARRRRGPRRCSRVSSPPVTWCC